MKLEYKSKKWDKEIKQLKEYSSSLNNDYLNNIKSIITKFDKKEKKDYCWLYGCLSLEYETIAHRYFADENMGEVLSYTYLSAVALLTLKKLYENHVETHYRNIDNRLSNIEYAVCKLISVDCCEVVRTCCSDTIMGSLLAGDVKKASHFLDHLADQGEPSEDIYYNAPIFLKPIYTALLEKDEKAFVDAIANRVKKYRKNMIGYSTIIDYTSIALIKLAAKYEINCTVDIVEIPQLFFETIDLESQNSLSLPRYEDIKQFL